MSSTRRPRGVSFSSPPERVAWASFGFLLRLCSRGGVTQKSTRKSDMETHQCQFRLQSAQRRPNPQLAVEDVRKWHATIVDMDSHGGKRRTRSEERNAHLMSDLLPRWAGCLFFSVGGPFCQSRV